jgi:hypothetical protein
VCFGSRLTKLQEYGLFDLFVNVYPNLDEFSAEFTEGTSKASWCACQTKITVFIYWQKTAPLDFCYTKESVAFRILRRSTEVRCRPSLENGRWKSTKRRALCAWLCATKCTPLPAAASSSMPKPNRVSCPRTVDPKRLYLAMSPSTTSTNSIADTAVLVRIFL